jgi:hypothetical protein
MEAIDLNKIGHGALFKGSKGFLVSGFSNRMLIPFGDDADMTYYSPRSKNLVVEPLGGFQQEWINACKTDLKTSCDFDYNGKMIEMMLLGLVAYRVGKKIDYDGETGRVKNSSEANELMSKTYRPGWTLEG